MDINSIFTEEVINHYKTNKNLITSELLDKLRSFGERGKDIALEILDTEKSDDNYYLDAFGEKISNNGNRNQKKAFTQMKLSKIHLIEIEKCKNDLMYFKDNYVKILTKSGYSFPETRPYQEEFLKDMIDDTYENIVSLQGRQSGKSITVSIYLAHKFNFGSDMNIGICANKGPLAREFLNNVKNIFEALPMWLRVGVTVWNKGSIESESKMRILTDVPGQNAFRGFTCAILVIDECAFIKANVWKEMEDSVFPSQSALGWKKNIVISTPNGINHFKNIVDGAKKGTNGFKYHFVNWKDVPRYDTKGNKLTPEQFKEKTVKKHGEKFFLQNFACSFVGSSLTLVSPEILESLTPSNYEYLRDCRLKIYKEPEKNHIYFLAVDGAKSGEDALTVQIVDLSKKPFEQVASAQLFKCNFQKMPVFIDEWGRLYNTALVIVENNEGAGTYIASVLKINYDYPNLFYEKKKKEEPGFRTTVKTRPQILDILKLFLDNKLLILHDEETIKELGTFISKNGKYQAENGFHDDLIMCLAVLFAPFCDTKNFDDITKVIESLYSESENSENLLSNHLVIGNFDTEDDESFEMSKKFENDTDFGGFAEFDDYSENDYFDDY